MIENNIDKNDIEYTNAILDEKRDCLFEIKDFKNLNKSLVKLNESIEKIPIKYKQLFEEYDHLFHQAYEYEICLMYCLGLKKGIYFKNT